MILFCDEDLGQGVPRALTQVHLDVKWIYNHYNLRPYGERITDTRWLVDAGRNGWLALSCNKKMLYVEDERDTIVREKVGIVFLTSGQEYSSAVLRLILNKWNWLETIDRQIERPFVYFMTIKGRTKRILDF